MNRAIRWAIWGAGAIAHKVASDFPFADGALLHAVGSRNGEHARRFAVRHGSAKWYEGRDALLKDAEVEAVYIATPNHRHLDDCLACMDAGKAVLLEKPFALNAAQAQRMVDTARRRQVFCMEAMWTRFLPAVIEAKRLIGAGAVGPVRLMQGQFAHPAPNGGHSRLFDIEMGGGVLLDIGVYLISLAHHLLGVPESVTGIASIGATGVDEQSAYQLSYAGGAMADFAASLHVLGSNEVVIVGEAGLLRLCEPFYAAHRFVLETHARPSAAGPAMTSSNSGESREKTMAFAGNGYQFELMEVNRCLREHRTESAIMPLKDTLEVLRTMDTLRAQWGLVYPQERIPEKQDLA